MQFHPIVEEIRSRPELMDLEAVQKQVRSLDEESYTEAWAISIRQDSLRTQMAERLNQKAFVPLYQPRG